jgi:hypothetical protein
MNDVTRVAPAQGFGEQLMKVLSDPNITADKLQVVLQMQKDILADRRREAFQTAFVAMAKVMPKVDKNGVVDLVKNGVKVGSYKYVLYEDLDEIVRPILNEHGFALTFLEIRSEKANNVVMRGELMHIDGHSISSESEMPPDTGPGRNSLQAIGSAKSYAKRYLAEGLCNIVRKGEDDDGKRAVPKAITPAQATELRVLMKAIKTQPETFLRLFVTGCEKIEEIQERDYPRLINALKEKQRSMGEKK